MIANLIKSFIKKAVLALEISAHDVHLEHPADEAYGDFSTNSAMQLFPKRSDFGRPDLQGVKNPRALAQIIVEELNKDSDLAKNVSKIEIAGPGFINFWLSEEYLAQVVESIRQNKLDIPSYHFGTNKKVMVEYAHFNTHKAVHIGHVRNITLGESLARILETLGNIVVRVSYGGDVGLHIAKCLYGIRRSKLEIRYSDLSLDEKIELLAKSYAEGNNAYEDDEEAKREIIQINRQIYEKHSDIFPLWEETKKWSLDQFDRIYKRVDTVFDRLYYESEVFEKGLKLSYKALKNGILTKSDGAIIFNGDPYHLHTRVFVTGEENPTYEGKELGIADLETHDHPDLDLIIHAVAPEQASFFGVTFKVEELLDEKRYKGKQFHWAYGYVRLISGKMSSRKGTIIKGEWLFDEVKRRVLTAYKDVDETSAETIAMGAVKYSMIKIDAHQDISFDIDQSISLEGNSGPYIQYAYARARSILRKSGEDTKLSNYNGAKLTNEERVLLRTLYTFPEVVYEAGKGMSPNLIANYLFDLAQKFNLFYQKVPILGTDDSEMRNQRLTLTDATSKILQKGLYLLGIKTLEKM